MWRGREKEREEGGVSERGCGRQFQGPRGWSGCARCSVWNETHARTAFPPAALGRGRVAASWFAYCGDGARRFTICDFCVRHGYESFTTHFYIKSPFA